MKSTMLCIMLFVSSTLELHANGVTLQESVQQVQQDGVRAYRELIDEVLDVQEHETVLLKIKRIKDLDLLIAMLEQDENDSPEIAERFKALREECQMHRTAFYEDLVRLKAALALMRARQENVSSEIES
jgi:hypothetical protein